MAGNLRNSPVMTAKGGFPLVELICAKRKNIINWFNEHAHTILINFLTKFSCEKNSPK